MIYAYYIAAVGMVSIIFFAFTLSPIGFLPIAIVPYLVYKLFDRLKEQDIEYYLVVKEKLENDKYSYYDKEKYKRGEKLFKNTNIKNEKEYKRILNEKSDKDWNAFKLLIKLFFVTLAILFVLMIVFDDKSDPFRYITPQEKNELIHYYMTH